MDSCALIDRIEVLGPLVAPLVATLGGVLLAFILGHATYRRQKVHELLQARYLDGGIDRFAANVDYALGMIRHNLARTLQVLKLYREVHIKEAAELASRSSFRLIEPERIDLEAGYRVQVLTRNRAFGRAQGLLFGLANAAENFFVNDVGSLIRLVGEGQISVNNQQEVLERSEAEAKHYESETDRFYALFYRLEDLGRRLEREHLTLRKIERFSEDPVVREINDRVGELFPPEEDEPGV
jgi:hypothetical protein